MITKKVNRYYCEFCKKSGGHAGYLRDHEKRCTMNPDRECRMCDYAGLAQRTMSELLAVLPDQSVHVKSGYNGPPGKELVDEHLILLDGCDNAVREGEAALREITGGCPACMLAALRQCDFPFMPTTDYFDYKKEAREFLDAHRPDSDYMGCY